MVSKTDTLLSVSGRFTRKLFGTALHACLMTGTALAGPAGGVVTHGQAVIQGSGSANVIINQSSQRVVINWNSFDTKPNESVRFNQNNKNAIALNRILGGSPTDFQGSLSANGRVMLINPNGVVFGKDAKIDVGGLIASTADINNDHFMNNTMLKFDQAGNPDAKIINNGTITAGEAGLVGFIAPHVENNNLIQSKLGKVHLASGSKFTLDLAGDKLVEIAVDDNVASQMVKNTGRIYAEKGSIYLTASQARNAVDSLIVNTGVIEAKSVSEQGGKIILSGLDTDIQQHGILDASGVRGGDISINGRSVLVGGTTKATGSTGKGGKIVVSSKNTIETFSGAKMDVSGAQGGNIIQNAKASISSGEYKAVGTQGEGGTIDWGGNVSLLSGKLDASGKTKGGTIRLGGTWKNLSAEGWDFENHHLDPSTNIFVSNGSELKAAATGASGDGGEIVLRAQDKVYFSGILDASPGSVSGNGGKAEISGASIALVDGNAIKTGKSGRNGELLLDPKNITITNAAADALQTAKFGFAYALTSNYQFGQSVALNAVGDLMAVGAIGDSTGGFDRGAVYLFNIDTANMSASPVLLQKITSGTSGITLTNGAHFGRSVALNANGSLLAVGAFRDSSIGSEQGSVFLLGLNTGNFTTAPTLHRKLQNGVDGITLVNTDYFGGSVALNATGSILAVGSERNDTGGTDRGAVYLFNLDTSNFSNAAILRQKVAHGTSGLTLSNNGYFGTGVALNAAGDIMAVGTYGDNTGGAARGALYLFNLNTSNLAQTAVLRKKVAHGSGVTLSNGDNFGFNVALNGVGDILVTAAIDDDTGASDAGAGYIFRLDPNDLTANPVLLKKITNGTAGMTLSASDQFGVGLAVNADATIMAISAKREDNGGVTDAGSVRLFDISPLTMKTGLSYGQNASGSTTLSTTLISQLLAAGNNLTLQANNDITINSALTVNNPTGDGATLTLQAGRSVVFNANVTTDNGNLIVIANDTLANGVVDAYRDAGNAAITMAAATTINTGTGSVQFLMRDGAGKTNTGSGDVTLYGVTAGSILVEGQQNLVLNGTVTISGAGTAILRANQNITVAATGRVITQGGEIMLNSDRDGVNGGGITTGSGAQITSNGGNITLAGGVSGNTYAVGTSASIASGVYLVGAAINAGGTLTGGDITIIGKGWGASTAAVGSGVLRSMGIVLNGSSVQTNNSGKVDMTGLGDGQTTAASAGIMLANGSSVVAAKGDITITGTGGGTGTGNYREGFVFSQTGHNIVQSVDTGNITILGTAANTANSAGVVFNNNTANSGVLSKDGNITITGIAPNVSSDAFASNNGIGTVVGGSNATGRVTLIGDSFSFSPAPYLQTTGDIVLRPYDATKTISIGTGGNLSLTTALFNRMTAGGTVWIGGYGNAPGDPGYVINTGNITWNNTTSMANSMALMTTGIITTSSVINMSASKNLSFTADTVTIGANMNGTGNLVLQPYSSSATVSLNSWDLNNPGVFSMDTNEINRLADGWNQITIGRANSTAYMNVGASAWKDSVVFRMGAGYARVIDAVTGTGDIAFQNMTTELRDTGALTTSGGNISTTGDLTFYNGGTIATGGGDVTVGNVLYIDSSVATGPTFNSGNGDITIVNSIRESGSTAGKTLTLNAGANGDITFGADVNGAFNLTASGKSIAFNGAWGGTTRLGNVSLTSADSLTTPSIRASGVFVRTTGVSSVLTVGSGTTLDTNTAGTGITLVTDNDFVRGAGSTFTTGAGRWLVYLTDPASTTLNGLAGNFNRYTCSYGACSVTVPTSGNGLLYAYTPMLNVTPSGISITYGDSANLTNYAYGVSGYLAGDSATGDITGTLNGSTTYVAGNNIGTYNIDHASGTLVSAMGYGFNYLNSNNALTVDRRVITVSLTGTSSKVYNGNTDAALVAGNYSLGNVYNSDDVSITNTLGGYDNKNVGSNKNVTVNGLTLGGTKANNYTLNGVTTASGTIGEVTPASVIVTASNATKTYGNTHTFAGTEFSQTGLIGSDAISSVTLNSSGAAAGATVAGGPYAIVANNASGTGLSNYTISYVDGSLTVNRANLTITANSTTKTYGTTTTFNGTEFSQSGLLNSDNIVSVTLNSTGASANATVAGGPYNIVASNAAGSGLDNYNISYVDGLLSVNRANLAITASNATKTYGDTVSFAGTEFSQSGLVSGDSITSITLNSAGAGATATVAGGPYAIVGSNAVGTGLDNYNITYNNGSLTVNRANLTINANNASKNYGTTVTFNGTEFGQSGLLNSDSISSISLNSAGAVATATVAGGPYAIVGSNANGSGLDNYNITYNNGSLTVNRANLTINANNANKIYGTTVTFNGTEFGQSGLLNSDSISSIDLNSAGAVATATVAGGPYAIVGSNAVGTGLDNYNITYNNGSLTVNRANLTINASNATKTYGDTVSFAGTEFSQSGLLNSDSISSISLNSAGAGATATVAGGPYAIVGSNANGSGLDNYNITYNNGSLTVNRANLTITANTVTKTYGDTLTFAGTEFGQSGLLNSDSISSVNLSSAGAVATAGVAGGPYTVIASGAFGSGMGNYNISYVNGSLTVNRANLTIKADDKTKVVGDVNPPLTSTFTGLRNGEDESVVSGLTYNVTGSTVGGHAIEVNGGVAANYNLTYQDGIMTVLAAPPTPPTPPSDVPVLETNQRLLVLPNVLGENNAGTPVIFEELSEQDDGASNSKEYSYCKFSFISLATGKANNNKCL